MVGNSFDASRVAGDLPDLGIFFETTRPVFICFRVQMFAKALASSHLRKFPEFLTSKRFVR